MEDTDPDLIDEICHQDENDQDQEGEGGGWAVPWCPVSNSGWSVLYLDVEI